MVDGQPATEWRKNLAHSVSCGTRGPRDISESRKGRQMRLRVIMPTISGPAGCAWAPRHRHRIVCRPYRGFANTGESFPMACAMG